MHSNTFKFWLQSVRNNSFFHSFPTSTYRFTVWPQIDIVVHVCIKYTYRILLNSFDLGIIESTTTRHRKKSDHDIERWVFFFLWRVWHWFIAFYFWKCSNQLFIHLNTQFDSCKNRYGIQKKVCSFSRDKTWLASHIFLAMEFDFVFKNKQSIETEWHLLSNQTFIET